MRSAFGNIFNKFPMKKHLFTFPYIDYIQTDYCICRTLLFCGSSVGNQQYLKLQKVHTCQFIHQLRKRYLLVLLIMNVLKIAYWVSYSQILWYLILIFVDIQCIFHYKLLSQCLRNIIEFLRTPVYQHLFTNSQTISLWRI